MCVGRGGQGVGTWAGEGPASAVRHKAWPVRAGAVNLTSAAALSPPDRQRHGAMQAHSTHPPPLCLQRALMAGTWHPTHWTARRARSSGLALPWLCLARGHPARWPQAQRSHRCTVDGGSRSQVVDIAGLRGCSHAPGAGRQPPRSAPPTTSCCKPYGLRIGVSFARRPLTSRYDTAPRRMQLHATRAIMTREVSASAGCRHARCPSDCAGRPYVRHARLAPALRASAAGGPQRTEAAAEQRAPVLASRIS